MPEHFSQSGRSLLPVRVVVVVVVVVIVVVW